jgi:hypothetical protein
MMNILNMDEIRKNGLLKAIVFLNIASFIGPLLAWVFWPPSSHMDWAGSYMDSLVRLLWPTRILALGTTESSIGANLALVLTNTALYLTVSGLAAAATSALKARPLYAFQLLTVIPIFFQLWFAGFSLRFVQWAALVPAILFYSAVGFGVFLIACRPR